jgi:hypothetical protein
VIPSVFEQAAWQFVEGDMMTAVALEEADQPPKNGFGWFFFFSRCIFFFNIIFTSVFGVLSD